MSQVQFGDTRVKMISQDFLIKNGTESNLLIQVKIMHKLRFVFLFIGEEMLHFPNKQTILLLF